MKCLVITAALCLGLGASPFLPGRNERACFSNLIHIDHSLNCSTFVHVMEEDGAISDGLWVDREPVLDLVSEDELRCPITGKDYVLTFKVWDRPYCPVHGHLLEKYRYLTHGNGGRLYPPGVIGRLIAGIGLLLLGVFLAVVTGIAALVRFSRTRGQVAQPSDGSAPTSDRAGSGE